MNCDIYNLQTAFKVWFWHPGLCTGGTDFEYPTFYKQKIWEKCDYNYLCVGAIDIGKILSKADKSKVLEISEDLLIPI